ncbi:hypothetical protein Q5H91_15340 [Sphingomonas sp. KR1UV-12]|uniref:Uncharacterized protein n=1 Tax=Sphingomonas aurea TaxID=3063994 RepID=A0ABT9EP68_9SPHN|nr:hypothetical protein [Sphingomonas sp. KR1UV-12]MDP1028597.1 hypothetical protein [Sphingomonas sp. KR1UV-12]
MIAGWRRSTWAIPILLALASVVGLVSALTGDGFRDGIAWVALALPVAATIGAICARR